MDINIKIATAGKKEISRIPKLNSDIDSCIGDFSQHLDEGKMRQALSEVDGVSFSGNDNQSTLAFAMQIIARLNWEMDRGRKVAEENEGTPITLEGRGYDRCRDKIEDDKCHLMTIRVDQVKHSSGGRAVRVRLRLKKYKIFTDNDRIYCNRVMYFVSRALVNLLKIYNEFHSSVHIVAEEWQGCEDWVLYGEAGLKFQDEQREALVKAERGKENVKSCGSVTSAGLCSPSQFQCEFYKNGRCLAGVGIDPKFDDYDAYVESYVESIKKNNTISRGNMR